MPADAGEDAAGSPGRSIARSDLEVVIRRAAELSLGDAETDEQLSEDEVVRIASELGLPARNVRQALYELPEMQAPASSLDRWSGPVVVSAARGVPGDAGLTLRRLEEYLTTIEYLQVVRRRQGRVFLVPADDAISSIARGFLRPRGRYHLARARRLEVSSRPLDNAATYVQIAMDFSDQRTSAVRGGAVAGAFIGAGLGVAAVALVATTVPGTTIIPELLAGGATLAAGIAGGVRIAAARFKARMHAARLELDGLLDRAEHGERLEPPPAPWRRQLRKKLLGS